MLSKSELPSGAAARKAETARYRPHRMAEKPPNEKIAFNGDDLWLASSSTFTRLKRDSGWELLRGRPSQTNKFLELADVALGLKKPDKPQSIYRTRTGERRK